MTEAELLPVLVSRRLWADRMAGAKVIVFVDSNPAKYSLLRGTSESVSCQNLVRTISIIGASQQSWPWYSRVPSKSNPSDGPSRLSFPSKVLRFTVQVSEAPQPISLEDGVWA